MINSELPPQSLTPNSKYADMLYLEFDIEVPTDLPIYALDYMYKLLLSGYDTTAREYLATLLEKMPWLAIPLEEIEASFKEDKETIEGALSVVADYPDGTILFCQRLKRYVCYINGKMASKCDTIDKLRIKITKQHGAIKFILKDDENQLDA